MTCYETSCWCAPIRCIMSCCVAPPVKQVVVQTGRQTTMVRQAALSAIGEGPIAQAAIPPSHTRNRTWHMVGGKMRYVEEEEKKR